MIVLSIGEMAITQDKDETIKTFALGSCVALMVYDKGTSTVGLVHIALPTSKVNRLKAVKQPGHFADTAVGELFKQLKGHGVKPPYENIEIKIVGGANAKNANGIFKIGQRNVLEIRKQLWKMGLYPTAEDVGDNISRSVNLFVKNAVVEISAAGRGTWEL